MVLKNRLLYLAPLPIIGLLYGQLFFWQNNILGWVLLLLYFVSIGNLWKRVWAACYGIATNDWIGTIVAWFTVISLLGASMSATIALYTFNVWVIFFSYVGVAAVSVVAHALFTGSLRPHAHIHSLKSGKELVIFAGRRVWVYLYWFVWLVSLYVLSLQRGEAVFFSPWQTIHPAYIISIFFLTIVTGVILFSEFRVKTLMLIVISYTVLIHLYIPLSHVLPWGGDVWRHLAIERRYEANLPVLPVLFGEKATFQDVAGVLVPQIFLQPQKFAYGELWGMTLLVSKTLQVDLLSVNIWLLPILWSLVVPVLLFRVAALIFRRWRVGVLFAAVTLLFFPFQAVGGFTLPVALGYIHFFFVLALFLPYLIDRRDTQARNWAIGFALLLLFGYPLPLIIFMFIVGVDACIQVLYKKRSLFAANNTPVFQIIIFILLVFSGMWFVPLLEYVANISGIKNTWFSLGEIKTWVGQVSGILFARHQILSDVLPNNIFVNHAPLTDVAMNIFQQFRWHVPGLIIACFFALFYGLYKTRFAEHKRMMRVFFVLFFSLWGGYTIGWLLMDGDHLFVRRLDLLVSFIFLVFVFYGLLQISLVQSIQKKRILTSVAIVFVGWFMATSYSSGPDTRVVSRGEYEAATYIWSTEYESTSSCVIGDTWPLLALEGISAGRIIGGGFPIGYQFAQPERVLIYQEMVGNVQQSTVDKAKEKTHASRCRFMTSVNTLTEEGVRSSTALFGYEPYRSEDMVVW